MTLRLVPMTESAITEFATRQFEAYLADRIRSGESPEQARKHAASEWNLYFPGRVAAPGHRLYWLAEEDQRVGALWLGPSAHGTAGAEWIYYVEIDETWRGKGLGRGAMLLAEQDGMAHGATELGLNVFGDNEIAQRLYRSAGYRVTAMNMTKKLGQTAE
jgi:ribosomal protein S18 acetylase RimI-like enzyme